MKDLRVDRGQDTPDSSMDGSLTLGSRAGLWLSQLGSWDSDFALGSALQGRPKDGRLEVGLVESSSVFVAEQVHILTDPMHVGAQGTYIRALHARTPTGADARGPHTRMCTCICQDCAWMPRVRVWPRAALTLGVPCPSPRLLPMDSTTSPCVSRVSTAHTPG